MVPSDGYFARENFTGKLSPVIEDTASRVAAAIRPATLRTMRFSEGRCSVSVAGLS